MKIKLLHTYGNREIKEYDYELPPLQPNEVRIKTLMVGCCRSDIDAYLGHIAIPFGNFGHESLGQIVEVGSQIPSFYKPADFVASRSDPAFGDFFNSTLNNLVKVPAVDPKYIIEPVACAVNIIKETLRYSHFMETWPKNGEKILILGSGFLSHIIAQWLAAHKVDLNLNIDVVGKSNQLYWQQLGVKTKRLDEINQQYSTVIELSGRAAYWDEIIKLAKPGGLVVYASTPDKPVTTNFFPAIWNTLTYVFPSPRKSEEFHRAMNDAVTMIEAGQLKTDWFWSKAYNRHNDEWKQAFEDGVNRPTGYSRGFIYW